MKFSSNFTFMLTALGYAAGFGSVWRFPYLVFKNGGGTFLVPYFFLLFTLAIPLFYLEISLGQLKGLGLAHLLELESPKFRGFGYIGIIICCYITSYYVSKLILNNRGWLWLMLWAFFGIHLHILYHGKWKDNYIQRNTFTKKWYKCHQASPI